MPGVQGNLPIDAGIIKPVSFVADVIHKDVSIHVNIKGYGAKAISWVLFSLIDKIAIVALMYGLGFLLHSDIKVAMLHGIQYDFTQRHLKHLYMGTNHCSVEDSLVDDVRDTFQIIAEDHGLVLFSHAGGIRL